MMPPAPTNECGRNAAVHEFKRSMDEIKRECPRLSVGAQQQMALERCASNKMNDEAQRDRRPSGLLRGMLSKLRVGNIAPLKYGVFDAAPGGDEPVSTGEATPGGRRRSTHAIRQRSVAVLNFEDRSVRAQTDCSECESVDSLQESLDNIEKSLDWQPNGRASRRSSIRYSLKMSGLSTEQLADVEEDEEWKSPDVLAKEHADADASSSKGKLITPFVHERHQQVRQSISQILPNEIKIVFEDLRDNGMEDMMVPTKTSEKSKRRPSRRSTHPLKVNESQNSSFLSVDSANFTGDFWAWRSITSHSSQSS